MNQSSRTIGEDEHQSNTPSYVVANQTSFTLTSGSLQSVEPNKQSVAPLDNQLRDPTSTSSTNVQAVNPVENVVGQINGHQMNLTSPPVNVEVTNFDNTEKRTYHQMGPIASPENHHAAHDFGPPRAHQLPINGVRHDIGLSGAVHDQQEHNYLPINHAISAAAANFNEIGANNPHNPEPIVHPEREVPQDIQEIRKMHADIIRRLDNRDKEESNLFLRPPPGFPLQTVDELKHFEEHGDDLHAQLLAHYKFVGDADNLRKCVHNIIHTTMTGQFARLVTFGGTGQTTALAETKLMALIIRAVKGYFPNLTLPVFTKEFGEVFRSYKQSALRKQKNKVVSRRERATQHLERLFQ